MNPALNPRTVVLSFSLGLVLLVLANSGAGQGNSVQGGSEHSNQPDLSSVSNGAALDRPGKSSEINQNDSNIDNTNLTNSDDTKKLYDKYGSGPTSAANAFSTEKRGRINYGRKAETMVTSESTSDGIKKTKHGSSDATEPTGAFKGSLLDSGLSLGLTSTSPAVTPSSKPNPLRDGTLKPNGSPVPHSSPLPRLHASPEASTLPVTAPPGHEIDLSLKVSAPAPEVAASPRP
jgi:hypothetical protein